MDDSDSWTPAVIPDLTGELMLVTGANSGIGFEATREFVRRGAHVVMACRSLDRGREARREIEREDPSGWAEVLELDLANLKSVETFAETVERTYESIDVLVNNAGVMAVPYSTTANGFERQFGVNHLGHFALTGHLLELLFASRGGGRVVTVSSYLHRRGELSDFDRLHDERGYDKHEAYGDSKLANLLFAYELQRRFEAGGHDVTSVAVHPGWAATNLQFRGPEAEGSSLKHFVMRVANAVGAQSAERGAWPILYGATHPDIQGGEFVGPGGFMNMRGTPTLQASSDRSYDSALAHRLWARSEEWTDVEFDLPAPDTTHIEASGDDTANGARPNSQID